jgi:hypothetical protein
MNRVHRARLHPPLSRHPGWAALRPAGVPYRGAGQAADDPFCQEHPPSGALAQERHCGRERRSRERGPAMAPPIAIAATGLFAAEVIAGTVGVMSVAIRQGDRNLALTGEATDPVTHAGRWVNGMDVRAPRRAGVAWPGGRRRHLLQRPLPGTASALQAPSPRPCTRPAGDPDAQ